MLFSIVAAPFYFPTNNVTCVPISPCTGQHSFSVFFFFFLMVAILTGVMWYLIAVLTYIFLTISEMSAIAQ